MTAAAGARTRESERNMALDANWEFNMGTAPVFLFEIEMPAINVMDTNMTFPTNRECGPRQKLQ